MLRNLASTAAFGDRIATTVGTWDEGGAVADALAHFYGSIDRVAADGLGASAINERAYRDAGRRMLALLEGISDLEQGARGLRRVGQGRAPAPPFDRELIDQGAPDGAGQLPPGRSPQPT